MKKLDENDVVKLLMDLSYLTAMLAVDIEEDRQSGMERLSLEFEQLDDLLSEIDEQVFNHQFARQAMLAARIAKRITYHHTPKTVQ
ncbi:hypothetical protein GL267_003070 [Acidithiobacillus ferrianus]|uniref:Uncharacterized protein n=2 Tax=Acidithiobacillus ferrianus TaxID=2678518 RepID=A0A845UDC0_9PROT|nr:hypothetical protein [Acidithiobacillus ferrianus]NDU43345.1 hypothetical protein [Acidithiobacillus ferrianus]